MQHSKAFKDSLQTDEATPWIILFYKLPKRLGIETRTREVWLDGILKEIRITPKHVTNDQCLRNENSSIQTSEECCNQFSKYIFSIYYF